MIAHRGASGHEVENSLAAFRAAAAEGADAVELDVYSTADGAFVIHHEEQIGGHALPQTSLRELRGFRLANGEPLPTLEEALAAIVPRLIACVEIKSLARDAEERLLETIEATGAVSRVMVHSFDHRVIRRLGARRPGIRRGIAAASYPVYPVRALEDADATIRWQHAGYVDPELVARMHAAGMQLFVWTVNEPAELTRFLEMGVDGLCTDFPDRARALCDARRD